MAYENLIIAILLIVIPMIIVILVIVIISVKRGNQNIGQDIPSFKDKSVCIQCGNNNPQNASFCAKCGRFL